MKKVLFVAFLCSAAFGQSVPTSFEAADIRVSAPSSNTNIRGGVVRGGRYEVGNATMVQLISLAYNLEPTKILGGPNWLDWERFNIAAKVPAGAPRESVSSMLQNLLADRFKLVVHKDTRPMPAFALSVGKGKPKMKETSGDAKQGCQGFTEDAAPEVVPKQVLSCRAVTMAVFADMLRGYGGGTYLPDPVVDQTGLTGEWDVELKWTPRNRLAQAGPDGITLFDAIDKQLGLKLEAQKVALPVLAVDSVNQTPTPNDPAAVKLLPPPPPAEFEVATIKPTAPDVQGQRGILNNGRVDLQNFTLKQLIQLAWELQNNDDMVVGLPKSAESARWDITAKVASSGPVNADDIDIDTLRSMVKGLIVERFELKAHMEDRPMAAYTMTATKQLKLQKADLQNRTNCTGGAGTIPMLNRLITCQNVTIPQFAARLQQMAAGYVRAPIKDATGLEGTWDVSVNFSGVNLLPGGVFDPNASATAAEPNGSLTLPEALQKQLGLKLDMEKRPLPVLVIDQVRDKPTEN